MPDTIRLQILELLELRGGSNILMEGDLCLSGLKEALGVLEEGVISFLN